MRSADVSTSSRYSHAKPSPADRGRTPPLSAFMTELSESRPGLVLGFGGAAGSWTRRPKGRGQHAVPGAPQGRGRMVLTLSLVGADFGGPHRLAWGVCFAPGVGVMDEGTGGARHSFAPALRPVAWSDAASDVRGANHMKSTTTRFWWVMSISVTRARRVRGWLIAEPGRLLPVGRPGIGRAHPALCRTRPGSGAGPRRRWRCAGRSCRGGP